MNTKMLCPRRVELGHIPHGWPKDDHWRDDNTCSWCGSLNPEVLLSMMLHGICELGPTDKSYKVYVTVAGKRDGKFYFQHFNEAQQIRFIELYNTKPRPFTIGYPGDFYVLPFFVRKARGGD